MAPTNPPASSSGLQDRARVERGFHGTESSLPDVKKEPASDGRPSHASDLLSHLGTWNPFPVEISASDTVWLLDNTAYRAVNKSGELGAWQAEFVAAVFDQNSGVEISSVVADVAEKLGVGKGDEAEATIAKRLMPFVQETLPARVVKTEFGGVEMFKLGPGGRNAISSDTKILPQHNGGEVIGSAAKVPQGADGILEMKTFYAEPEGWGVISDIDDTIKVTQTSDPIGILRSTFVSDAEPIEGMPELYSYIQTLITPSSPFFYLSASPYNLYSFLHEFRENHYPQGTIVLREASWSNLSGLLSNLTVGTQEYKVGRMKNIHSWIPSRKMICIGDSTQSDPEAYGEIYKNFPGWVHLILIRKVTDIAAIGIKEKNEPERFEKAFKGVPDDAWHLFETPEECRAIIKRVVEGQ